MSLWLNLIPQLHRPGEGDDISMRHHHFQEEDDQYYDGYVRPQTKERPPLVHIIAPPPPVTTVRVPPASTSLTPPPPKSDTALQATTTECPPNTTILIQGHNRNSNNNLLRKLASSHYQSYTTALTVTIAVGCFLLLLNILIFAGIYHQRDRGKSKKKQKEELAEADYFLSPNIYGSCSSSSGEAYDKAFESRQMAMYDCSKSYQGSFERKPMSSYVGEFSCDKRSLADVQMTELPLQEFNSSPPPAKHPDVHSHPPDVTSTSQDVQQTVSPSIPDPPPPPRGQPPIGINQTGSIDIGVGNENNGTDVKDNESVPYYTE
ncbi:hypothetical protein NQ317_008111 [Molorchus minor]|uniref:Uncharacterized protein n=1 Tax=Molorchus minor TaxID=1323400 RepID=A0ABQ9JZM9_9CUCU|nr:hypothetical protein NQ317_008111 [Molorchus minor]